MSTTPLEILVQVAQTTARVETKVDTLLGTSADHETRLRRMERWRWSIPGAGVIATALAMISIFH